MANILSDLVVRIRGDASDLNESLKNTFKETKEATQGFQMLGKQLFKAGAILTAFGGGVLLLFKNAFDNFLATVGDPALEQALTAWDTLVNEISITIGEIFAPVITDILESVTKFIKEFKDGNPELFNFIISIIGIGGAIIGLLGVIGLIAGSVLKGTDTIVGIGKAFGELPKLVGTAGEAFVKFAKDLPLLLADLKLKLAAIAPELIILGAILIALFVLWKTGFLDMNKVTDDFAKGTGDIFEGLGKILEGKQQGIKQVGIGIWEAFFKTTLRINAAFQKAMNSLFGFGAKTILGLIIDLVNSQLGYIEGGINKVIDLANTVSAAVGFPLNLARANFEKFSKLPLEEFFDKTTAAANKNIDAFLDLNDVMGEQFRDRTLSPETFAAAQQAQAATSASSIRPLSGWATQGLAANVPSSSFAALTSAGNSTKAINGDVNINIENFMGDQSDEYMKKMKEGVAELFASDITNRTGFQPFYENP